MTSSFVFTFGDFELDETRFELRRAGEPVAVQRRVMDLLIHLVKQRERVATREEIFAEVWPGVVVTSAALGHAVMEARRALGEHGDTWIQTVRGRGFRFVAPVVERGTAPPPAPGPARQGGLVGQRAVWQAVSEALGAVGGGRGTVLFVGGDEGSGKTRLLEEARADAESRGIAARSYDLDETRRDGDGDDGAGAGRRQALDVREIEASARAAPLLVAVDDAHLASAESLALVQALARLARRSAMLLIVVTGDADRDDERSAELSEIARAGTVVRLERLTTKDVGALVLAHTGRAVDPHQAAALHVATGGNPRLVLQLASSGLESSGALRPGSTLASSADALRTFRRAARARAEALTPASFRVLSAAAVLGRDIVVARVAALLAEEPSRVFGAIDEALVADLVRRRSEAIGSYRFTMGLVRDGLYEALPEEARARLHLAAARLPASAETPDVLCERARHCIRAGLLMNAEERAVAVARAAGALVATKRSDEAVVLVRGALGAHVAHEASPDEARRVLEAALADAGAAVGSAS
jgi:DNA-binding winged helix-turn-helix (wHTH) protein/RecA/RadA recombinase